MRLSELKTGQTAVIIKVFGHGGFRRRILEMGFVRGQTATAILNAPLNDPIKYGIMGYEVSLRRSEASMIEVVICEDVGRLSVEDTSWGTSPSESVEQLVSIKTHTINIALVGNPNSGKTSLFNALSGGHEHVGNYSGVTIGAKSGTFTYKDYTFNITDLPGTYALSAYTPEELYVREHLIDNTPDVVVNAVVASNLERNLYLTTELIDINPPMVVALSMYDELQQSGAAIDYRRLGGMLGVPMVPIAARSKQGLDNLLDTVIEVYENRNEQVRHIHVNYSSSIEKQIAVLSKAMKNNVDELPKYFPPRYWAIKLLEGDCGIKKLLATAEHYSEWLALSERGAAHIKKDLDEDVESAVTNDKYGFIAGALQETYTRGERVQNKKTTFIDRIVTNRFLGFPIFLLVMFVMFWATFTLGAYPQQWIETLVSMLGEFVGSIMNEGAFKDLLVNGIIGGVGSVIVFLPNILILYLFISLMEDSGYMARAAFIMDKIMHRIGLHGKSFIPLVMGFGCNVPAIMASRTIESRSSRIITILINPFMSCSARLPVFILLTGIFFESHAGLALSLMYLLGVFVAVVTARLLRRFLFKKDETPFVMELPPYRTPTLIATVRHMWEKCEQYLKKIGGVVLLAAIVIWFLSYYPHNTTAVPTQTQSEESYLGHIGKFCEPVMEPLGLNWKASVALLSGTAAKEIIVSTMGVLYAGDANGDNTTLSAQISASGDFTTRSAVAFMIFILIYFPCIASLAAIAHETGSWRWALFSALYNTSLAWLLAFVAYTLIGLV